MHLVEYHNFLAYFPISLPLLLIVLSRSALAQLSVDIQQLYTEVVRTSDAQSKSRAESQESLEVISRRMDSMEEIHRNSQASAKLLQDLCLSLAAKPLQQTQQEPTRSKDPSLGGPDSITSNSAQQGATQEAEEEPTIIRELAFNEAPLGIPVSWRQGRNMECSSECRCWCHMQQNVQALSSLGTILGRLFLAYTGSSILRKPCNLSSCREQNARSIRLTYFFPQWFLNSVVSTTFSTTRLGAPSLNLKVRKIVPDTNRLFTLCMTGGVDGIQQMFADRDASPDDIHHRGGWTPLHVRNCLNIPPKITNSCSLLPTMAVWMCVSFCLILVRMPLGKTTRGCEFRKMTLKTLG